MAGGAAAAEAPVLAYLVVGLLAAVAFVVCLGLRAAWMHTLHLIFEGIASVHLSIRFLPDPHPFAFVRTLDTKVLNALHDAAQASEHTMGYFFHGAAVIQGWVARELSALSHDTLAWASWLQHSHLPKWVKALIYAAVPPLLILRLVRAAIAANLPHLGRVVITKVTHQVVHTVTRIAHATTGAVAIPGWVIRLPRRVGRVEHDFANVWKRLRRLELVLGATGAAALLARALGVRSVRCFRDGNAGRAVRRLCGMDAGLIDALLADTLLIVGGFSLVELAKQTMEVEDVVVAAITSAIREL